MSDRKYRQHGYQDSDRDRPARQGEKPPRPKEDRIGPRSPQMPGRREVVRCAGCGAILAENFDPTGKCPRCGFELHSCKQCAYFDTSKQFECTQPIPARIPKKDAKNVCTFYAPRTTSERETSSPKPTDARAAFENLFKK